MKKVVSFFLIFLAISLVSAFEIGNKSHKIEIEYASMDFIKGWINISLSNDLGDSLFTDSKGNSIKLIDLLKLNNVDYSCSPSDCKKYYSSSGSGVTQKTFTLNKNEEKIIGIKLTGNNFQSVSGFKMNVSSTALETESTQLYIDILNDGKNEWVSNKPSNNFYGESYGCYANPEEEVFIYNQDYCQKIELPPAPNVEIGARVISATGGNVNFEMNVCSQDFTSCGSCEVSATTTGKISCIADFPIFNKTNYYVCITTLNSADNNKYKINSEIQNACGYAGSVENSRDFEIFAKPGSYASIGTFTLNNDAIQESGSNVVSLEDYVRAYIGKFNNDCSTECVVPIKFLSGENQQITLSSVSAFYTSSGTPKETIHVYDVTETQPKISSNFKKINLDKANIKISGVFDEEINYTFNFKNSEVFSEEILIKKIPQIKSLNPKVAIAAYPTDFTVEMEDNTSNVLEYTWNFGDNSLVKKTSANTITHTYSSIGEFKLNVTATDTGFSSSTRTFDISIKTPKDAIEFVLNDKQNNLDNVNLQISTLPTFQKNSVRTALNMDSIESQMALIQQRNNLATTDAEYVSIMTDLIKIKVPIEVFESIKTGMISFFPDSDNIDVEILSKITGEDHMGNSYFDSIVLWNLNNVNTKISFSRISANYEDFTGSVINVFRIEVDENLGRENSYLIIKNVDNLLFSQSYNQKEVDDYSYIELSQNAKTIEFSTSEELDFETLPVFISPKLSYLPLTSVEVSDREDQLSRQTIFILSILLALFIGAISYIALQQWYKRKYESYLFKNRNDLYNLISYIQTSMKKGVPKKTVRSRLIRSGWTTEQVNYVMKKYSGERTGMLELPIESFMSGFKKKQV